MFSTDAAIRRRSSGEVSAVMTASKAALAISDAVPSARATSSTAMCGCIDFIAAKLGAPHQMRFGAYSLYGKKPPTGQLSVR